MKLLDTREPHKTAFEGINGVSHMILVMIVHESQLEGQAKKPTRSAKRVSSIRSYEGA